MIKSSERILTRNEKYRTDLCNPESIDVTYCSSYGEKNCKRTCNYAIKLEVKINEQGKTNDREFFDRIRKGYL